MDLFVAVILLLLLSLLRVLLNSHTVTILHRTQATVEPNNSRSTRSAADKNPGMEKSKLTRPPPRRSTRLANAQPEYDNQQLDELHARAASKESDNNDAKPAAVETKRPSRGRAAKKKSSSSDAIAREAGSNDADEDDGRACGRPAKKAAPTTRCGAAGEKKAAGKRKRAPREDPQPNKTTRQQLKKLRSAPSESIQQKKTPKQQQQDQQAAHHNLVLTPFDPSMYTVGLSVFDTPNQGQVLCAPEYVSDILQRLYNAEVCFNFCSHSSSSFCTTPNTGLTHHVVFPFQTHQSPQRYLHNKRDIEYIKMRGILVDWLVSIHMKFRLVPECLYLAVNIVDRYLAKVPIEKDTLQLVGMTSLFIAAKYEEIYPPEVKDFVYISDRSYTKQEVLDLELEILDLLEYNVSVPTGYPFLSRFLFITSATDTMSHAASYYMERTLLEHESLKYRPSEIAAAAVCLAINHPEIREADEIEDDPEGMVR